MHCVVLSPVGSLRIEASDLGITALSPANQPPCPPASPLLRECVRQLNAYFAGQRTVFDLPLYMEGTPFQLRVWQALRSIPYGETCTYGQLAAMLGQPTAARAVGGANHRNPLCILIPCHRVIGADGSLTGYGAGLDMKAWLLDHERQTLHHLKNIGGSSCWNCEK